MRIPKWLKWLLGIIAIIALGLFIFIKVASESIPEGTTGAEADALANKVLAAIDKPAWDTTGVIQWSFPRGHDFLWDRTRNLVKVNWDENEVLLNPDEISGKAWTNGTEVTGDAGDKLVKAAWGLFCNDSFWLNAPAKVFDPGTERRLITLEDGSKALLITYVSGGTTPGDSYLWILDDKGLPTSYKMWTSIIPIGGIAATWENWTTLPTGAKIATNHVASFGEIPITNVKGAKDMASFGLSNDPFQPIL